MPSLEPSAESGSLKHLDLNDNRCNNKKKAVKAICNLINKCTQLQFLSLSDNNIDAKKFQRIIFRSMRNSEVKVTLTQFSWNYDIQKAKTARRMINVMSEEFEAIQKLSLVGAIKSKKARSELREHFQAKENAQLLLTDKDFQKDRGDEHDEDTSDSDEDSDDGTDSESKSGSGSD
jgi:hypothetical protein